MDKISFFKEACRLTDESLLAELDTAAAEKTFRAREYITAPGESPAEVWFLADGAVCFCSEDGRGRENVDMILSQPGLVSSAVLFEYASRFGEKALTQTTILSVPRGAVRALLAEYPEMSAMWVRQIRLYALKYWKLRMVRANMPLAERIRWFRQADPVGSSLVSNAQLASFLGSSRESISRVRARSGRDEEYFDIPENPASSATFRQYYEELGRFGKTNTGLFGSERKT